MNGPLAKSLVVFMFGMTMALHTYMDSELLYALTPRIRPKAVVIMDDIIAATLVNPLGRHAAVMVMAIGSIVLTGVAYRRQIREQAALQEATINSATLGQP